MGGRGEGGKGRGWGGGGSSILVLHQVLFRVTFMYTSA